MMIMAYIQRISSKSVQYSSETKEITGTEPKAGQTENGTKAATDKAKT